MTEANAGMDRDDRAAGTLALSGPLTFATASSAWREAVAAIERDPPEVIDLAAVTHSDSAGLACVLALLAAGRRQHPTIHVANAPETLRALARACDAEAWLDG